MFYSFSVRFILLSTDNVSDVVIDIWSRPAVSLVKGVAGSVIDLFYLKLTIKTNESHYIYNEIVTY